MPDIIVDQRGSTTWIRLNRPERRNAFDPVMSAQICAALSDTRYTRSFIITGSRGSFCAGGALTELSKPEEHRLRELYTSSLALFDAVRGCPRPVLAAVNGAAAGGGNELVVACDLAIAGRSATFGQTGPRVGSAPVTGGTNVMGIQIGEKRAKELSLLCRRYGADDAYRMGLVNAVVDDDDLEDTAAAWCAEFERLSARYLEITKVSSNLWWHNARDNFASGLGMLIQAIASPDMAEGAAAFLDKRRPQFPFETRPDHPGAEQD